MTFNFDYVLMQKNEATILSCVNHDIDIRWRFIARDRPVSLKTHKKHVYMESIRGLESRVYGVLRPLWIDGSITVFIWP